MLIPVENLMQKFGRHLTPGAFLVDIFPVLQYVPSWVPGARFKKLAQKWREELLETVNAPYQFAKQRLMVSHVALRHCLQL